MSNLSGAKVKMGGRRWRRNLRSTEMKCASLPRSRRDPHPWSLKMFQIWKPISRLVLTQRVLLRHQYPWDLEDLGIPLQAESPQSPTRARGDGDEHMATASAHPNSGFDDDNEFDDFSDPRRRRTSESADPGSRRARAICVVLEQQQTTSAEYRRLRRRAETAAESAEKGIAGMRTRLRM